MGAAYYILGLGLAPLLPGIINRVKAKFGGRRGRPYLQLYYDLAKLFRKDAVYSVTTTPVLYLAPLINLGAVLTALLFVPLGGARPLLGFTGDFFLVAYLLAMGRYAMILAALDTGSAFEGMGSSREATFAAMTEPVLLLGLVALGMTVNTFSLGAMLSPFTPEALDRHWAVLILLGAAFFIVLLSENSRIPVDDPTTHLELTMIHEAMVLDHSGVDLALIELASALKLWFFCTVVTGVVLPDIIIFWPESMAASPVLTGALRLALALAGMAGVAFLVGVTESVMARLRLYRIPQLLALAAALAALSCLFCLR